MLAGKTAFVTGGASGIGRAVVRRLLQDGANVSFCDYNKITGEELAKELSAIYGEKVLFQHCDVRDNSQLEDCFNRTKSRFSGLDIVVNNAGIADPSNLDRIVDINLKGMIRGTQLALKHMGRNHGGSGGVVVNIGSSSCLEIAPSLPEYSSIKLAVNRLSMCYGVSFCDLNEAAGKGLAKELSAKYGEKILFQHCDVKDSSQLEDSFSRSKYMFSGLDIVVNNAAIVNEVDWDRMVDINLKGVIRGTQLALKHMGRNHGGSGGVVVNMSSTSCLESFPSLPVYTSIKSAVNRASMAYGEEFYFKRSGVKVICLIPGLVETTLSGSLVQTAKDDDVRESVRGSLATYIPMSAEYLADCFVELLEKAESGSLWVVRDGKPAFQVKMEAH